MVRSVSISSFVQANVLRIRALSGGLTRQQHVALLLFLKGASSSHVSPEASGHVGSGPAAPASATAPPSATCLVESNSRIEIDGVDLKLGLWTDGDDVCWPEAPLGESSVLRIVGSGFRIEDVETLSKRDRPSTHSAWMNPLSGPRDSVPEDSARSYSAAHPRPELLEKEKAVTVVLEDLKVLLDRRANRTESTESPPSAAELPEIVDTILERRPGKEPPFEVTWRSRGDQPGKLEVTLAELDWRLDAQLIQEVRLRQT